MWEALKYVNSGLALVAFLAAVAAWVYGRKLKSDAKIISQNPESEDGKTLFSYYEKSIDNPKALTKNQRHGIVYLEHDIVVKRIQSRSNNYLIAAVVVLAIAVLFTCLAVFAIAKSTEERTVVAIAGISGTALTAKAILNNKGLKEDLDEVNEKLNNIVSVRDQLQKELNREQNRKSSLHGGVKVATDFAEELVSRNSEVKPLATILRNLLMDYEADHERMKASEIEDLQIRLAKATLANAEQRYDETFSLITPKDLSSVKGITEKHIEREVVILSARGNALIGKKIWDEACKCYERINEIRSRDLGARQLLARCYFELGREIDSIALLNGLIDEFTKMAEKDERDNYYTAIATAYQNRGLAQAKIRLAGEAISSYDKSVNVLSDRHEKVASNKIAYALAESVRNRAGALVGFQRYQEALVDYDRGISLLKTFLKDSKVIDTGNLLILFHLDKADLLMPC